MLNIKTFCFNPFHENTYLWHNKQDAWLIDPGCLFPEEQQQILTYLAQNQLTLSKILLTHAHLDHCFGLQWACDHFELPVHLHPLEVEMIDRAPISARNYGFEMPDIKVPQVEITPETSLLLGDESIHILFTPGHSPGSISFHAPASAQLISGDVIFANSIGRTDLYKGDFDTLIDSIKSQIFPLPNHTIIYSGHGPQTLLGDEKQHNPFLQ
jgi:hydroxyacylglutathione hydrolase